MMMIIIMMTMLRIRFDSIRRVQQKRMKQCDYARPCEKEDKEHKEEEEEEAE
jgi:hypothetical protein